MSNPPGKPRQVGQSEFGNMKSTMHINSEIFHPGSIISGFLKLECKESTFVRGIWVKLIGEVVMHYKTNFKQHTNAKISSNSMLNEIKIDIFEEYIRQRHIQLGCLTEICKLKRERMEARVEQPNRVNAEDVGNDPANMSGTVTTSSSTNASSASSPATKDEIELKKFTQQLQAVQSDYHNNALHQVLLGE